MTLFLKFFFVKLKKKMNAIECKKRHTENVEPIG